MTEDHPQDLFSSSLPLSDEARWTRRRERFYQRALGPLKEPGIYHFEDGYDPHVDVYAFGRTPQRDHEVLITGGMADRAQPGPTGNGSPRPRTELLLRLPRAEGWAATILREVANLPFAFGEPLGPGSLVCGSRPIRPGSLLRNVVLAAGDEPALDGFLVAGETVRFLLARFITAEEFAFAEERSGGALLALLAAAGVGPVTDLDRMPVV